MTKNTETYRYWKTCTFFVSYTNVQYMHILNIEWLNTKKNGYIEVCMRKKNRHCMMPWKCWTRYSLPSHPLQRLRWAFSAVHASMYDVCCVCFYQYNAHNWISKYFYAVYYFQFFHFSPFAVELSFGWRWWWLVVVAVLSADHATYIQKIHLCCLPWAPFSSSSSSSSWLLLLLLLCLSSSSSAIESQRQPVNVVHMPVLCMHGCGFGVAQFIHHCSLVLASVLVPACVCLFFG